MAKSKAKSKVKPAAKKAAPKKAAAKKPAPKKAAPKKVAAKVATKPAPKAPPKAASKMTAWADFFTPVGNRLLVEREEALTKTAGGLFIPDFAQERPNHAKVLVAGPGARDKKGRLQPLDVQVGDRVLFVSYAGMQITLQGQGLVLVKEDEIQAILP